jgi:hypothetical protein
MKPYQAGPRLDVTGAAPDAYLRNIPVNTRRSWWRPRWRQGSSAEVVLEVADPPTGMRSVPWCGRLCPGCSTALSRP